MPAFAVSQNPKEGNAWVVCEAPTPAHAAEQAACAQDFDIASGVYPRNGSDHFHVVDTHDNVFDVTVDVRVVIQARTLVAQWLGAARLVEDRELAAACAEARRALSLTDEA
jgi:hypothetical protein